MNDELQDYIESYSSPATPASDTVVSEESLEDVDDYMDTITSTDPERIDVDSEFDRLINEVTTFDLAENPEEETGETQETQEEQEVPQAPEDNTIIPTTNPSSLVDEKNARFSGAVWYNRLKSTPITIVGAGGIGYWAAFLAARLGISYLTIFDSDSIEEANMAGQLYSLADVGTPKVTSICNLITRFSGYVAHNARVSDFTHEDGAYLSRITIGAVDNMLARRNIFNSWVENFRNDSSALLIDGRLTADELQIFVMRGDQLDRLDKYEREWLFSDSEAEETNCSFKQTSYMAAMIGSLICNCIVNHCANLADENVMFDLPFFISYNAETMYFKAPNV